MEPDLAAGVEEQRDVREGAGAEAAAEREVDLVADASPRPLAVLEIDRDRGVAALGVAAAAAARADKELAGAAEDVDRLAVRAPDDVPRAGGVGRARQAGDGVRGRLVVLVLVVDAG